MLTNEQIGLRLESRRLELNLTMQEVAAKMGIAKSTVQRYEKGKIGKIKLPVIESFAIVLDVNPSWLIGKSNDKRPIANERSQSVLSLEVNTPSTGSITKEEAELLRKYRRLDERGRAAVWNVLEHEYSSIPGSSPAANSKEA